MCTRKFESNISQRVVIFQQRISTIASVPDPIRSLCLRPNPSQQVFLVSFPHQESLKTQSTALIEAATYSPPPSQFSELHPFHMLLSEDCRVLQFGSVLARLFPGLQAGKQLSDFFEASLWLLMLPLLQSLLMLPLLLLLLCTVDGSPEVLPPPLPPTGHTSLPPRALRRMHQD